MKTTAKPQPAPAIETQNDEPVITAFEAWQWIPDDAAQDATVPARQLSRFADHVLDVAKGAALVFELIGDSEYGSGHGRGSYLDPYHLSLLRRLATRSLNSLHRHAEEIADEMISNSWGKS